MDLNISMFFTFAMYWAQYRYVQVAKIVHFFSPTKKKAEIIAKGYVKVLFFNKKGLFIQKTTTYVHTES